jgi:hypothetical protein
MSNSRLSGLCISIGRNPGPCGPSGQEKIQKKIQEKTQEKTQEKNPDLAARAV